MCDKEKLEIITIRKRIAGEVVMPGSKSFTNRALIMAALNRGESRISGCSESDDSEILIKALKQVGVKIRKTKKEVIIKGNGGNFEKFNGTINLGMAGTAMRFFAAVACLISGKIILDGNERMRERPIAELVDALRVLGAEIKYLGRQGCPPIEISKRIMKGGAVAMSGGVSSQYFTALLLIAPILPNGLQIKVRGKQISKSYIDMTIDGLKDFGVKVENNNYKKYAVGPKEQYKRVARHAVEGDASGASYFWAMAAVSGGRVKVKNINPNSFQGDVKFPELLRRMGCEVVKNKKEKWVEVKGLKKLKAIRVNMEAMPDTAQTLAVAAAFAEGKTTISGLSTLKDKETDRLLALQKELAKMNIKTEIGADYIVIQGGQPKGALIETYNDHRMAMAFAVAGVGVPGVTVKNSMVVTKSFPEFWIRLKSLGVKIKKC
ncbi:MAG: 3-phosphoshikimate 1-carboxyvinyltransferase [Candidatus Pacebacteria bacterium]|nr:3-phosphoshikimate 1-carboxyvinyltransferase [Candidatus Paceibacterota bacterium]